MKIRLDLRRMRAGRLPVVLLGGLNIGRALGLAGIPVIIGSSSTDDPAFASRYCCGQLVLPPGIDRHAAADALLRTGERLADEFGARLPLLYGNDDRQRLVQEHRDSLSRCYALLLNDAEVANALIEKILFQPFAEARGLPVPRALEWEALQGFERPVLVKPRDKFNWESAPVHTKLFGRRGKARIFPNGSAVRADRNAAELRHEVLLQEYVSGNDRDIWSYHGFADEQSRLLGWFIGRKIRTFPALTGISTFVELAHDDELAAFGQSLVARVPLKGVFKIDFKRDALTGRLHLLEVNARYNLWHYLGAVNGINLPALAYAYLVRGERPQAAARYRTAYRWVYLRYDWRAYRELAARRELGLGGWLASLLARPLVCQLFAWRDPMPFLRRCYDRASTSLPRVPARVRRWLSTAS